MGNKYTTSNKALEEIPGSIPDALDEEKMAAYIEDASRYVDARLSNYAGFADIEGTPPTPAIIEKIARLLVARDCLIFMGEARGEKSAADEYLSAAEKMLDDLNPTNGSKPRAMIPADEYDYTQTPTKESSRLGDASAPHSIYRADVNRKGT